MLLLERAAEYGGTSAMAGGHFYLGGGTAVQQATGVEDSAEEMFKYLMAVSLDPDEAKIRAFCDGQRRALRLDRGARDGVRAVLYEQKAVIQPGTEGLMFTGNEKVHPFRDLADRHRAATRCPSPATPAARRSCSTHWPSGWRRPADVRYETGATNLVVTPVPRAAAPSSASPGGSTTTAGSSARSPS